MPGGAAVATFGGATKEGPKVDVTYVIGAVIDLAAKDNLLVDKGLSTCDLTCIPAWGMLT